MRGGLIREMVKKSAVEKKRKRSEREKIGEEVERTAHGGGHAPDRRSRAQSIENIKKCMVRASAACAVGPGGASKSAERAKRRQWKNVRLARAPLHSPSLSHVFLPTLGHISSDSHL